MVAEKASAVLGVEHEVSEKGKKPDSKTIGVASNNGDADGAAPAEEGFEGHDDASSTGVPADIVSDREDTTSGDGEREPKIDPLINSMASYVNHYLANHEAILNDIEAELDNVKADLAALHREAQYFERRREARIKMLMRDAQRHHYLGKDEDDTEVVDFEERAKKMS
jgi:hypothetical protein